MVNIQKSGDSAIKFTFTDNDRYLYDGEITVPLNSLILVLDESDMVVIKKVDGDVFLTFLIDNTNFSSKAELEEWFKENACGSTGGGGGVTSGEVQTMIDESISGLAESSAVTEEISEAVSGKADTSAVTASINAVSGAIPTQYVKEARVDYDEGKQRWYVFQKEGQNSFNIYNFSINGRMPLSKQNGTYSSVDNFSLVETSAVTSSITSSSTNSQVAGAKAVYDAMGDKADTTAVTASINSAVSGKMDTSAFNTYSASTDARISEDEEVTSAALNELNDALSGKQDTLIAGSGITIDSANTISCTVEGGGKAIEAGRGIAITTGATADTVSFDLPISAGTGINNIQMFNTNTTNSASNSLIVGGWNTVNASNAKIFGSRNTVGNNCTSSYIVGNSNTNNANIGGVKIIGDNNKTYSLGGGEIIIGYNNNISGGANTSGNRIFIGEGLSAKNPKEIATGKYNVSYSGSTEADKSLFSVGNGTSSAATHNAFEIRQNGDIYITSGGTDIKLQDNLGGGGLPESAFTAYTAATDARLAEDEEVTAAALNELNNKYSTIETTIGDINTILQSI